MKNRWIQIAIVAVGSYLIYASIKSLVDLKKAGGRLEQAKTALAQIKADNRSLQRKLLEVSSPDFIEKEARDKLNMQRPGEVVVVLPETSLASSSAEVTQSRPLTNAEKWWKLFFD